MATFSAAFIPNVHDSPASQILAAAGVSTAITVGKNRLFMVVSTAGAVGITVGTGSVSGAPTSTSGLIATNVVYDSGNLFDTIQLFSAAAATVGILFLNKS